MSGTLEPRFMPEHNALLAVDMIGSGGSRPEHLQGIPELISDPIEAALRAVGIGADAVLDDQFGGDGFLRAYPSRFLPMLVDMVGVLDELLTAHNRVAKPEIRLRIAAHVGPLPVERGFYRPNIDLSRLLGAAALKQVVRHCQECITGEDFTTALILSDTAYKAIFDGDYARVLTRQQFASLLISNSEFNERSWVRVAGVHPSQISKIEQEDEPTTGSSGEPLAYPCGDSGGRSISNSGPVQGNQVTGDGNTFNTTPHLNVNNHAGRSNGGVQTGVFNGVFSQGRRR